MTADSLAEIGNAINAGRFAEAEGLCRIRLQTSPEDEALLLAFAISLHYQHKLDEAVEIYAKLTREHPDSCVYWGNYGTALHEAGQWEEAEAAFRSALDHPPVDANTLLNFGLLLLRRERYPEARETLMQARADDSDSVQIALAAARACNACGDYRTDDLIAHWRDWLPLNDEEQLQLARILLTTGDADSARGLVENVSQRSPGNLQASIQLANVYERVNRLTDADNVLQRLDANPALDKESRCEIDHQRAALALRHDDPASAKSILIQTGARHDNDVEHYFDLARACDKLGEPDQVMHALAIGHNLQIKKIEVIAPQLFEPGAPIFPRTASRTSESDYRTWPKLISPESKQSPIFVVGFPRSGTTLLEQMLDAHPRLQSMDERPFFNILADQMEDYGARIPEDLARLGQRDCDELRKGYLTLACSKVPRRWNAQLVDKNPLNMLWLPMIHRLFPNAKWILALRHPCDVVLSCYMQSFRANVLAAACANLERVATGYVEAMEHWLYHIEVFKPDVHISRYEDLVADAMLRTEAIARFLDIEDGASMLRFNERAREKGFIATPSYTQVIQPITAMAVNRWQRYRREFEPVLPILKPMLEHWQYSID